MTRVKIKGMSCGHCVKSATTALTAIPGIGEVKVDLEKGEATYEGDIDRQLVIKAIHAIGFEVEGRP